MYGEKATPEQITEITRLASSGYTAFLIGKELGVCVSKVRRWLEQNNIYCTPSAPRRLQMLTAQEQALFRAYYKTMPTQKAIFAKYKIFRKILMAWLKEMNLEPHPPTARPQATNRPAASQWSGTQLFPVPSTTPPGSSIADRFRAQGLATIHPDRY
jgi:hypothetical protein